MDAKTNKGNISEIVNQKLCCTCGACSYVCPQDAISFYETVGGHLFPKIDLSKCNQCGICRSVCPGIGLTSNLIEKLSLDPFIGSALQTFVGKATDETIYNNSQSGGIVSAILAHALGTGKIVGALTTLMVAGNPPRVVAKLAKNIEQIKQAQKSKYCPFPVLTILDEVVKSEKPVAVVGVACQIHGLYNILDRFPQLKEKIAFTVGLICDRTMTYGAIDYLLKRANGLKGKSKTLHFRDKACGGYPGNVNVIYSEGTSVSLPSSERMKIKDFFTPARCRICFDKMNIFSDITVGDPWGIDSVDQIGGESVVIIRTENGRNVFQNALLDFYLTTREINYNEVVGGQGIEQKRFDWLGYIEVWDNLDHLLPNYCDYVKKHTQSKHQNIRYRNLLQHALSLDSYPSQEALMTAIERKIFIQNLKSQATLPLRKTKRIIGKIIKRLLR